MKEIAAEIILLEAEREIDRLRAENAALCELAEARLKDWQASRAESLSLKLRVREADETIVRLKEELRKPVGTRKEPSRLEIAAMIYAAGIASNQFDLDAEAELCGDALNHADALIAEVKESGK